MHQCSIEHIAAWFGFDNEVSAGECRSHEVRYPEAAGNVHVAPKRQDTPGDHWNVAESGLGPPLVHCCGVVSILAGSGNKQTIEDKTPPHQICQSVAAAVYVDNLNALGDGTRESEEFTQG